MAGALPQLAGGMFLSDGGLETSLVFLDKIELPHFAAFVLLNDELGRERLMGYYVPYLELCAQSPGTGFVLETPNASADVVMVTAASMSTPPAASASACRLW